MKFLIHGADTRHGVGKGEVWRHPQNDYHRFQSKKRTLELEYFCKSWLFRINEVCILLEGAKLLPRKLL